MFGHRQHSTSKQVPPSDLEAFLRKQAEEIAELEEALGPSRFSKEEIKEIQEREHRRREAERLHLEALTKASEAARRREPELRSPNRIRPMHANKSREDLVEELLAIGRTEGKLLDSKGSELRGRIQSIGAALEAMGGHSLMLDVHDRVAAELGRVRARELEGAWDGVGRWLG